MNHGISIDHPSAEWSNLMKVFGLSVLAGMVMAVFGLTFNMIGWMQKSGLVINAAMVLSPEQMDTILMPIVGALLHVMFSGVFGLVFFVGIIIWRYLNLPGSLLVLGLLYGAGVFVVNAGVMAPLLDIHPPFWQQSTAGMLSGLTARLIYGAGLGIFLGKWAAWPGFVSNRKN